MYMNKITGQGEISVIISHDGCNLVLVPGILLFPEDVEIILLNRLRGEDTVVNILAPGNVVLTLYEKKVQFKEQLVKLHKRENFESWFELLNPKRQVPVLKSGNDIIADSDAIIDYVCRRLDTDESRLVPDVTTAAGEQVAEFRTFIQLLPIKYVTYGLILNPRLQAKRMRLPDLMIQALSRKNVEKLADNEIAFLRRKKEANPELSGDVEAQIESIHQMKAIVYDESRVSDVLDDLEQTFDTIEQQLEKSKRETSSRDFWLFGAQFTAADISTATFLHRIYLLGVDERYFSEGKRPLVHDYYRRLCQRPAFQKMVAKVGVAWKQVLRSQMGASAVKAVKISVVVGVAALIFLEGWKFWRSRRGFQRA